MLLQFCRVEFAGYIVIAALAYFLGSIPTGFLVARARGVDIRTVGSGNIGATNVLRVLGKPAGTFVLVADALKGLGSVLLVPLLAQRLVALPEGENVSLIARLVAGFAAIFGHNYTCWLKFKGGKGIATSAGVMLGWVPLALVIVLAVWIVVFFISRYVSLASILAAASLPLACWLTDGRMAMIAVGGGVGALAIYKHKTNIRRLRDGTENRFGTKKETAQ